MKTKHILTALALPAMFAACTADDIVSENNGLQQDQRAKLSKDFVLKTNSEVDSRYAVEGTTALEFNFEKGDKIGANLIDAYEAANEEVGLDPKDPATWKIVDYIAPALPFENDGEDTWKSAGELGVGNYLFTNPYNPEDKNRAAAKFELPIVVQYSSETPNAHIENYNKAVATTILREGDAEATINLKNLYTYPKIRVNFPKADGVTKVTKVVLKRNGGFIYKGSFDHQAIVDMFSEQALETYFAIPANKNKTEADYWAEKQTSNFIIDQDEYDAEDMYYAQCLTTPTFVYEMNEKISANSFEVRLMIPSVESLLDLSGSNVAAEKQNAIITMYICTNEGNYKFELTDVTNYAFKETTLATAKDKALWRNKSNTLTVNAEMLEPASEAEMDGLIEANIVSTAADWNALVTRYGDLKKYSAAYKEENKNATNLDKDWEDLVVTIVGDEFALTSDLKMPEVAEFVIESNVAVEGDVTLKNILIRKATAATAEPVVTVKEGATLTTDQTFKAPVVDVEEGATLKVVAAYDEDEELIAYDGIKKVVNAGEVTIVPGAEATFNLQNNKSTSKLYVGAAASRAAETDAVLNLVNIEISENDVVENQNDGEIYNYGVLNVKGTFTSNAPSITAGYKKDKEGEWIGMSKITNEGSFNAEGVVTNHSEFVQNKILSSNFADGKFNNLGTMTIKADVSTYIDSNKDGRIILSEKKPTDFTIHGAKDASLYEDKDRGEIRYTATAEEIAAGLDMSDSPVTYLITNGNVELKNTFNYTAEGEDEATICALNTLVINGGDVKIAGETVASGETVPAPAVVEKLIIASGKATISSKINSVSKVHVAENATLEVMESTGELIIENLSDVTFGTGDPDEGDKPGVLYVNGKMHLTVQKGAGSIVTLTETEKVNIKTGKEVSITCQSNAYSATDEQNKTYNTANKAYQTALYNALLDWASDVEPTSNASVSKVNYDLKDTETVYSGTRKGAAEHFREFVEWYGYNSLNNNKKDVYTTLYAKYNELCEAYINKTYADPDAETSVVPTTWSVTKDYTAAVDSLIARNKKVAMEQATWNVESGANHIYNAASYDKGDNRYDTAASVLESWTPAQKALADFVDEVKKTSSAVTRPSSMDAELYKCVVITGSTTSEILAPKYSQVFVSDVIYKIFGKDAIGYTRNWFTYGKLSKAYNKKSAWDNALVKNWINDVAQAAAGNGYVDKAKTFLTTNSVLDIFQDWNYDAEIIESLAAQLLPEAEGNDSGSQDASIAVM